jgi:hypothetical protein
MKIMCGSEYGIRVAILKSTEIDREILMIKEAVDAAKENCSVE